jgi:hypothetical protein
MLRDARNGMLADSFYAASLRLPFCNSVLDTNLSAPDKFREAKSLKRMTFAMRRQLPRPCLATRRGMTAMGQSLQTRWTSLGISGRKLSESGDEFDAIKRSHRMVILSN